MNNLVCKDFDIPRCFACVHICSNFAECQITYFHNTLKKREISSKIVATLTVKNIICDIITNEFNLSIWDYKNLIYLEKAILMFDGSLLETYNKYLLLK